MVYNLLMDTRVDVAANKATFEQNIADIQQNIADVQQNNAVMQQNIADINAALQQLLALANNNANNA